MIQSQLTYMIEIWGAASFSRLHLLQVMQNRALRNVFDIHYLTPRFDIFSKLAKGIFPLKLLYELCVAKYVYKILNGISSSGVTFTTPSHGYPSRNCGQLVRPRCRTESAKKRISYSGPLVYNSLPSRCKRSRNVHEFTRSVKNHFSADEQILRGLNLPFY